MKKIIYLLMVLLLFASFSTNNKAEGSKSEKHLSVMVFDITGSMVGGIDGQRADIFDDVKDIAYRIIRGYPDDTYLVIIPFGRGVKYENVFEIQITSAEDKEKAIEFIANLRANEPETWLTYSLRYSFNKIRELENSMPDFHDRTREVLLLTDGLGNGPEDLDEDDKFSINNLINEYNMAQADFPYLYTTFFTVDEVLSESDREVFRQEGIDVVEVDREDVKVIVEIIESERVVMQDIIDAVETKEELHELENTNELVADAEEVENDNIESEIETSKDEVESDDSPGDTFSLIGETGLFPVVADLSFWPFIVLAAIIIATGFTTLVIKRKRVSANLIIEMNYLTEGAQETNRFPITICEGKKKTIGPHGDIPVEDLEQGLPPVVFVLKMKKEELWLTPFDSITVNGTPVNEATKITIGDMIGLRDFLRINLIDEGEDKDDL
jgi:hypothetical protein